MQGRSKGRKTQLKIVEQELHEFVSLANSMNIPLEETFAHFARSDDGRILFDDFYVSCLELGFNCFEGILNSFA